MNVKRNTRNSPKAYLNGFALESLFQMGRFDPVLRLASHRKCPASAVLSGAYATAQLF